MNFPTKPQVEGQSMAESYWFLSCGKTFKRGKDYIFFPLTELIKRNAEKLHSQNKEEFLVDARDAGSNAERQYATSQPHMHGFQAFT